MLSIEMKGTARAVRATPDGSCSPAREWFQVSADQRVVLYREHAHVCAIFCERFNDAIVAKANREHPRIRAQRVFGLVEALMERRVTPSRTCTPTANLSKRVG
jgi:predicted anti-sigma-YlaC factor YlaD